VMASRQHAIATDGMIDHPKEGDRRADSPAKGQDWLTRRVLENLERRFDDESLIMGTPRRPASGY